MGVGRSAGQRRAAAVRRDLWGARCAAVLGVIFVYAAWGKIADPATFAELIYHYKMLPHWGANLTAVALPWVELAAGICLVAGVWQRPAALLTEGLLVLFILVTVVAWIRPDVRIEDCGCFAGGPPRTPPRVLVEDSLMFLLGLPAYLWTGRRRDSRGEESDG